MCDSQSNAIITNIYKLQKGQCALAVREASGSLWIAAVPFHFSFRALSGVVIGVYKPDLGDVVLPLARKKVKRKTCVDRFLSLFLPASSLLLSQTGDP
jgi:hypothetical protein